MNIEVTLLCSIASAYLGYMSYKKKNEKDIENDATQKALLSTDIKYIRDAVSDIRTDFKELKLDFKDHDTKINSMSEKLARVEESTKSAHHRIDELTTKKGDVLNEK